MIDSKANNTKNDTCYVKIGKKTRTKEKETKVKDKEAKSDSYETYPKKRRKRNQKMLVLMRIVRDPNMSVRMSSRMNFYIGDDYG